MRMSRAAVLQFLAAERDDRRRLYLDTANSDPTKLPNNKERDNLPAKDGFIVSPEGWQGVTDR
jgi:hypothetical protein